MTRTTLLGRTYEGEPMVRSLASSLVRLERAGKADEAQALLDAENKIASVLGRDPIDLASQFTRFPNSMATMCPSALAVLEIEPLSELKRTGTGGLWA